MTGTLRCSKVTHGTLRRQVEAGDFLITESDYAPGLTTETHAHASTSIVFGVDGALEEVHGSHTGELRSGTVLVLPRDIPHADRVSRAGCTCLLITLSSSMVEKVAQYTSILDAIRFASGGRVSLVSAAVRHECRSEDSLRALAIEGLVYDLVAVLARQSEPGNERAAPWLRAVRERLAQEFLHPPAIAVLALDARVHPAYLMRAFARCYGQTVGSFLRRRRVEWSMEALQRTSEPIASIAQAAGFFDQSHFTRCFKRIVGLTPARYRSDTRFHGRSSGA